MNADGSNMTQLTNTSDWESSPTWSPDGSRIAYDRALPAGESQVLYKIHIMNANGSNQVPLQADPLVTHYNPSWSPNGSKIALIGIGSHGGEQMYTVKVNGTDLKRLTGPSTGGVVVTGDFYTRAQPDWSPDGSKILFARYGCGLQYCSEVNDYEVIVIYADGSGRKRLTNNVFHDVSPVWSPNGRRIVFASDRDGDYEIWKMMADGSSQTQLTFNTVGDRSPDWQPLP